MCIYKEGNKSIMLSFLLAQLSLGMLSTVVTQCMSSILKK